VLDSKNLDIEEELEARFEVLQEMLRDREVLTLKLLKSLVLESQPNQIQEQPSRGAIAAGKAQRVGGGFGVEIGIPQSRPDERHVPYNGQIRADLTQLHRGAGPALWGAKADVVLVVSAKNTSVAGSR
jgi:hypothetical protein